MLDALAQRWGAGARRHAGQVTSLRNTAGFWLLSLFLALGPVYWLPGIPPATLRRIEWSVFVLTLALVFGSELLRKRLPFPSGLLGPLGFGGLLLLWIPGMVQASALYEAFVVIVQIILGGAFFWCFYCIARDGGDVHAIFRRAFILLSGLAGVALTDVLLSTADWQRPCEWSSFYVLGFSIRSTAWSPGLGVFVPVAALFFLPAQRPRPRPRVWQAIGAVGAIALLGSQFVSGGRTGLLASLIIVAGLALLRSSRRLVVILVVTGLLAGIVYADPGCTWHFRLEFLLDEVPNYARDDWEMNAPDFFTENVADLVRNVDFFTRRRLQGFLVGLDKIVERPLLGHGAKQVRLEIPRIDRTSDIHHLWLRWAVATGIFAPLLLLTMIALVLRTGWRTWRDRRRSAAEREGAAVLGLVVLYGLIISNLEPYIPIGAFQVTAIWWAALGSMAGMAARPLPTAEGLDDAAGKKNGGGGGELTGARGACPVTCNAPDLQPTGEAPGSAACRLPDEAAQRAFLVRIVRVHFRRQLRHVPAPAVPLGGRHTTNGGRRVGHIIGCDDQAGPVPRDLTGVAGPGPHEQGLLKETGGVVAIGARPAFGDGRGVAGHHHVHSGVQLRELLVMTVWTPVGHVRTLRDPAQEIPNVNGRPHQQHFNHCGRGGRQLL